MSQCKPDDLIKKSLLSLEPYVAALPDMTPAKLRETLGLEKVIKLSFNENPYGPSPLAVIAMRAALNELNIYHDVDESDLKRMLCAHHGVTPAEIILGDGADEIVQLASLAFLSEGDEAIIPRPTYVQYVCSVLTLGATPVQVPVRNFKIDLEGILERITPKTKMIFLCNPNNPTGTIVSRAELQAFFDRLSEHVVVVIDEAYSDYVTDPDYATCLEFARQGHKVLGIRTFSKIHALAAARVGYGLGSSDLVYTVARARMQVNVNHIGLVGAAASLKDTAHRAKIKEETEAGKAYLYQAFNDLGLNFVPSQGNFIFVDTGRDSKKMLQGLAARGVVVRPGYLFNFPTFIRVTVGTPEQNDCFVGALREVLAQPEQAEAAG
ncbi:MAG: histidinol-phosphate transaminase [bacterium]